MEIKGRFKKHRLRLHKSLPDSAIGSLAKISALGMLKMCLTCGESDLYVGKRRANKHSSMDSLLNMSDNKSLPIKA